jgi:hypothetical protein
MYPDKNLAFNQLEDKALEQLSKADCYKLEILLLSIFLFTQTIIV